MEQLKEAGFNETYCITLVDDHLFFEGDTINGIYQYFRDNKIINDKIYRHVNNPDNNQYIKVNGEYLIEWYDEGESRKKYILKIS